MILTKSISRFARNTLDTLKYVRMLKEKNVAILFEEENINTGSGQGELVVNYIVVFVEVYLQEGIGMQIEIVQKQYGNA